MAHTFLTVAIPVAKANVAELADQLDSFGNPVHKPIRARLHDKGIHFLSMALLPSDATHGSFLLIEASTDPVDAVHSIVEALGDEFATLMRSTGSIRNANERPSASEIKRVLNRYSHSVGQSLFATPGLNFTGTPDMDVGRITNEFNLARLVRNLLQRGDISGSALQVLKQVRQQVEQLELEELKSLLEIKGSDSEKDRDAQVVLTEVKSLLVKHSSPLLGQAEVDRLPLTTIARGVLTFTWPYLVVTTVFALAAGLLGWWQSGLFWGIVAGAFVLCLGALGLIAIAAIAYFRLRSLESSDIPSNTPPDSATLAEVIKRENPTNEKEQNHLYGVVAMKPGLLRNLILRIVFWVIAQAATKTSRPGFLNQLGTIHFARWILLPGTNKLLFFSNYGGSWESYLEDFITKAHAGLTGVWSNTVGFPKTKNVFQDGATDGDRFKRWARSLQLPTLFWYSAYPHLTTARIRLNAAIRQGLVSAETEDQADEWLSCFGSRPLAGHVVESSQIQSILFGGFRYLPHAASLLVRLPQEVEKAQNWLVHFEPEICFGDTPPAQLAQQVAFTNRGLARLGCTKELMSTFPMAFQEGMSAAHRANLLLDTGDDHPRHWLWGNDEHFIDAAILVYALTEQSLNAAISQRRQELESNGGELLRTVLFTVHSPNEPVKEPFGFVDGVSQPIIRGVRRWLDSDDKMHVVEPGEFILGYLDNRGFLPLSPTMPPAADPANVLPAVRNPVMRELPEFSPSTATAHRDFGCNGSYLVIRQLEQDVTAFSQFLSETAGKLQNANGIPQGLSQPQIAEWLAAKIVGRWKDGTSLVRYPHSPGTGWDGTRPRTPDNSFLLGEEDPLGMRCPFGSHIRRTNPRDSLLPGSSEQLDITNRHRILRMGRAYAPDPVSNGNPKPGLFFMCLNADIERQFEFIQQTWAGARLFHGLDGEVDPILGRGGKGGRLTVPTSAGPIQVRGIQDFVKVRGGGYFFLPGRRAIRFLAKFPPISAVKWKYTPVTQSSVQASSDQRLTTRDPSSSQN